MSKIIDNADQTFNYSNLPPPDFRMENVIENGTSILNLFIQTFELIDSISYQWRSCKESEWHLLAKVAPAQIIMYPIHIFPTADRYRSPKNGQFETIIYEDGKYYELPDSVENLINTVSDRLPSKLFDPIDKGLGLVKKLDSLWINFHVFRGINVLVISQISNTALSEGEVCIRENELDKLRKRINRVHQYGLESIRVNKKRAVHGDLFTKLDPDRFKLMVEIKEHLVQIRQETAEEMKLRLNGENSKIQTVRKIAQELPMLVNNASQVLLNLHSEIERVTLAHVIEKYESLLNKKTQESHWQNFLEQNKLVLNMVFARPVSLLQTQFYARPSNLKGKGAQIGDFLFGFHGQSMAIVEIKKPGTQLVQPRPYRGEEVFGPSSELSGAVTQVLFQQSELRQRWMQHTNDNSELRPLKPDVIKCVVIAGTTPDNQIKLRSLEVFRNNCKEVEIITFDELLKKLKTLHQYLTPAGKQEDAVPF